MAAGGVFAAQRGHLFVWIPVCLAIGIGAYFALPVEPGTGVLAALGALAAAAALAALRAGEATAPAFAATALVVCGLLLAAGRAHLMAAPVLGHRYYGPIEGRVVAIDRSASDKTRLTLDRVVLARMAPAATPARVRVSLHGEQGFIDPRPGLTVVLTGHLSPPAPPPEPGGFDFQRRAWFQGLGAVGYTRTPVLALEPPAGGAHLLLARLRQRLSAAIRARMPGEAGAFAAAILTGDRSGVSRATLADLRRSNLAHLLAISGLHMGLLTGIVFAGLRGGLALVPAVALRWPTKKMAAVGAIAAGAVYLALSGGNVATQRAFVMVAVVFLAVLLDRRAFTLRAVALAALIVLLLAPENLVHAGFQMSFAATVALVAVFGALRDMPAQRRRLPPALRPVAAVVLSSAVAGAATAPVAAAHFNQIAQYGLLANLATVPLMGILVMPAAVAAACLAPLGLAWVGLGLMRLGILWVLWVAGRVAALDGVLLHVVAPGPWVLPALALGALWAILWLGRARLAGLAPVALGLALWAATERPALLIDDGGTLVGLMTEAGRVLNKARSHSFVATSWLENDGDGATQPEAAARTGFGGEAGALTFTAAGRSFTLVSGRGRAGRLAPACRAGGWVVYSGEADTPLPQGCRIIDAARLAASGTLAVYPGADGPRLVGARPRSGDRLWSAARPARGD